MEKPYIFKNDLMAELGALVPNAILSQTFIKDEQLEVTLFQFAAGQELSEHTSAFPAIVHILQGEGTMTLGKDAVKVQPGSWVYMPPDLPHSLKTNTPLVMLLTLRK